MATISRGDLFYVAYQPGDDAWNIAGILTDVLGRARIARRLTAPITTAIGV